MVTGHSDEQSVLIRLVLLRRLVDTWDELCESVGLDETQADAEQRLGDLMNELREMLPDVG